jgi:GNAT superfamily N-acetyltransferase
MRRDEELEKRIQERTSVSQDDIVSLDIVLEDGRAISRVGMKEREVVIYGCRTKVGCIGGVATKPEYREKGLATRLMGRSIQRLNDDQGDIMLVSGDRDLYRRQGCVGAATFHRFRVTQMDADKFHDSNVQLMPYNEEDLPDIVNIHQKEPVRFHRALEEFRVLLERRTPAPFWTKTDIFVLRDDGRSLGYVITQGPRGEERGKGRIRAIAEYAGIRRAIADSIKPIFAKYGMEELVFFVPEYDVEFLHTLKQRGIQGQKENLRGHTFKIVNLPRLMDRFAPYIEERVGRDRATSLKFAQEADKFSITYKQERLELDGESLVALIFGTHDETEREIISRAERMVEPLQALFPLSFPWPGLNSY